MVRCSQQLRPSPLVIAQLVERLTVVFQSVSNADINWSAVRFRLARSSAVISHKNLNEYYR